MSRRTLGIIRKNGQILGNPSPMTETAARRRPSDFGHISQFHHVRHMRRGRRTPWHLRYAGSDTVRGAVP
eukprot:5055299-Prymnesium_polylepis.1